MYIEYQSPMILTLHSENTYIIMRNHMVRKEGEPYMMIRLEPLLN